MADDEKKKINKFFKEISNEEFDFRFPKWMFEKLKDWIYICSYALCYFKHILPSVILDRLNEIFRKLSLSKDSSKSEKSREFLIDSIAYLLVEKLKLSKKYSQKKLPIIISVSLSLLLDFQTHALLKDIDHNLFKNLLKEKLNQKLMDNNLNEESLNDLYAIIVDTTWFNWFPVIAEKLVGTNFPDGFRNCYYIIYNENIGKEIDCDPGIFNSIIKNNSKMNLKLL